MQRLASGFHKFRSESFRSRRALFERLAKHGQNPETLFITCSDSRVVPNLITNTEPGELFLIRNVGNIVPAVHRHLMGGTAGAIEYAVEVLGVSDIVVCGHTQCGAMEAIVHPERVKHLPYVARWLAEAASIPAILEERYGALTPEARLNAAVQENVLTQLENLRSFAFVSRRLDEGTLHLSGWVFKIATAEIFAYDPSTEQFLSLDADNESPLTRRTTDPPPIVGR